jgi:hypothetical protein
MKIIDVRPISDRPREQRAPAGPLSAAAPSPDGRGSSGPGRPGRHGSVRRPDHRPDPGPDRASITAMPRAASPARVGRREAVLTGTTGGGRGGRREQDDGFNTRKDGGPSPEERIGALASGGDGGTLSRSWRSPPGRKYEATCHGRGRGRRSSSGRLAVPPRGAGPSGEDGGGRHGDLIRGSEARCQGGRDAASGGAER